MRDMHLDHYTLRDDSLTHQVIFSVGIRGIFVSCNCRRTVGKHHKAGKIIHEHIGMSHSIEESRELYNNPDNHWAPFGKEDEAKW